MNTDEVHSCFIMLIEELQAVANEVRESGARCFQTGDYEEARRALDLSALLDNFIAKARALQQEWTGLAALCAAGSRRQPGITGRLARGLRTPRDAFRRPILEVLVELGGQGTVSEVLRLVEKKVTSTPYDHERLPSDPRITRWKNTAQCCRLLMVQEGLLEGNSPRGVWEITKRGRAALESGEV